MSPLESILQVALQTADSVSKESDKNIKELNQTIEQLIALSLSLDDAKRFAEESRKALLVLEELKKNLEALVDMGETQAKLAEDDLVKMEDQVEEKINAGKMI